MVVVYVGSYRRVYGVCRGRCLLVLSLWCGGFPTTVTTDLRRGWLGGMVSARLWLTMLSAVSFSAVVGSSVVVAISTVVDGLTGLARLPRWWNRGLVTVCALP